MGGIEEYRLNSNDLSVLLMEDHSAPVLTFMVTYRVGTFDGIDETPVRETNLAEKIKKANVGDIEVYSMKTGIQNVVTITGSLAAGSWYSPSSNSMIADLAGNMLDQGTRSKNKFQIPEELENIGASISFSVNAHALNFDARCLTKDLPKVMSLLAEQLREPAFATEELEKLKIQRKGAFQRSRGGH